VLLVLVLGLPGHVAITLVAPIFYARKDTKTPVVAALLFVAVNVVGAIVLFGPFGLTGLAIAMGLGAYAEVGTLTFLMARDLGLGTRRMLVGVLTYLPGAALAGAAAYTTDRLIGALTHGHEGLVLLIVDLGLATVAGGAGYLAWSYLARLDELSWAMELGGGLMRRLRR
jgi:putative peptidoglycan lipid II flippase